MAMAQASISGAQMDSVNPFFKSRYASLGSVIEAAKPYLAENELSVSQHVETAGESVSLTTLVAHSSGQWMESTVSLPLGDVKGKSLAQELGGIVTYLRRYAYSAILGIYADEDMDGNGTKTGTNSEPVKSNSRSITPAVKTITDAMWERMDALMVRAEELGIQHDGIDPNASYDDFVFAGRALSAAVKVAEETSADEPGGMTSGEIAGEMQ
jgi:hypothetical protein